MNAPSFENSQIHIKNLRLRTLIGIYDFEKEKKQDVIINVWIDFCSDQAALSDEIKDTVDYKTVSKNIIAHVEGNQFNLIERMAEDILKIALKDNIAKEARVEIDKPGALRFCDSVSVSKRMKKD